MRHLIAFVWVSACVVCAVACASAPKSTKQPRELQNLARLEYCGRLEIQIDALEPVNLGLSVCSERRDNCEKMLGTLMQSVGDYEVSEFHWKSCASKTHKPIKAAERRLLRNPKQSK